MGVRVVTVVVLDLDCSHHNPQPNAVLSARENFEGFLALSPSSSSSPSTLLIPTLSCRAD